jgi:hypothetical protein
MKREILSCIVESLAGSLKAIYRQRRCQAFDGTISKLRWAAGRKPCGSGLRARHRRLQQHTGAAQVGHAERWRHGCVSRAQVVRLAPTRSPKGFFTLNIEDPTVIYAIQAGSSKIR